MLSNADVSEQAKALALQLKTLAEGLARNNSLPGLALAEATMQLHKLGQGLARLMSFDNQAGTGTAVFPEVCSR